MVKGHRMQQGFEDIRPALEKLDWEKASLLLEP